MPTDGSIRVIRYKLRAILPGWAEHGMLNRGRQGGNRWEEEIYNT